MAAQVRNSGGNPNFSPTPITCPVCAFFTSLSGKTLIVANLQNSPPMPEKYPLVAGKVALGQFVAKELAGLPVRPPAVPAALAAPPAAVVAPPAAPAPLAAVPAPPVAPAAPPVAPAAPPAAVAAPPAAPVRMPTQNLPKQAALKFEKQGTLVGLRPGTKPPFESSVYMKGLSKGGAKQAANKIATRSDAFANRCGSEMDIEWGEFRETVKSNYLKNSRKKHARSKRRSLDDFELSSEVLIPESLTDFITQEDEMSKR